MSKRAEVVIRMEIDLPEGEKTAKHILDTIMDEIIIRTDAGHNLTMLSGEAMWRETITINRTKKGFQK